ncbi:MAG: hypothetical protein DRJ30_03445 [Candidatus Methanomethylicota archaeon]|nr:MAG: hypothetical protein DRJ30_03445 [Candidatus Verstraetearchaeota archaeon]
MGKLLGTVDLLITGGNIFWKNRFVEASIAIDKGKIVAIGKEPNLPKAEKTLNFKDKIILPGLIDVHVHLRDQNLSYKETFESGTMAAAAGGLTTILDMPNNDPLTISPESFNMRVNSARGRIYVNVGFYSLLPGDPTDFKRLVEMGVTAFKLYLNKPYGNLDISNDEDLASSLLLCKKFSMPIAVHAEDYAIISKFEEQFKSLNLSNFNYFLHAHSKEAEIKALLRLLKILKNLNYKVHISHLSTAEAAKIIAENRDYFTCEVTPHHLFLDSTVINRLKGFAIMAPPLRSKSDITYLWRSLRHRIIDIIASDHAPHSLAEKISENVWKVKPGIPGLETMLPLMLDSVNKGLLSLNRLVELMAENPARIFRLPFKGFIDIGFDADLTIVDLHRKWLINPSKFMSKAKYSPFNGFEVAGYPFATIVKGRLVFFNGEIFERAGEIVFSKRFSS